ncbi:hypothetical protein FQN55_000214 [Onygenales sp. PD_40]|nr:hypothetical protein FQN55_000214 [Onygenales sp. PD_40]
MSGSNPFRHRKPAAGHPAPQPHHQPDRAKHTPADPAPGISAQGPSRSSPRQKTVRIASPPVPALSVYPPSDRPVSTSTTSSIPFPRHGTHRGSPPPPSPGSSSDDDSPLDPFNPDASGSDNGGGDSDAQTDIGQDAVVGGAGRDWNQYGANNQKEGRRVTFSSVRRPDAQQGIEDSPSQSPAAARGKRATMDVDAFKRLLMTGDTGTGEGPSPPSQIPSHPLQAPPINDSSSNTDTGSASKQTIFETHRPPQADTPRTSHDMSTSEADAERRKLVAQSRQTERPKPPPPKTRHGKPIKNNVDQASPIARSSSINSLGHRSSSSTSISSAQIPQQERDSAGDINKPLPQPQLDTSIPSINTNSPQEESESPLLSLPQNKRPPTPPLARRHSQMKPKKSGLSRNNSARLSLGTNALNTSSSFTSSPLKTPPPPPSRRKDRDSLMFPPPGTPPHAKPPAISHDQPPPPPSRQRSDSNREDASDQASLRSIDTFSSATTSNKRAPPHGGPPRPPPPRRTGGSRASLDESRPVISGSAADSVATGTDSTRRRSPSSSTTTSQSQSQSHATDILADLTRLQKEVDDLRGQYEGRSKPGSSHG